MSCDVEINIFGKVSNPEAVWELANAAAASATVNFSESFENTEFVQMLEKAAAEGTSVTITGGDTKDLLDEVTTACAEAGLSYVMHYADTGSEKFTDGMAWRPGMRRDFEFSLADGDASVKLSELQKAAAQGIDAVNALIDRATAHTRIGKVEMEPGFSEALQAYLDSGEAWGYHDTRP
ncbi:hypothetical protein D3C71_338810 [compost metagenome]